LQYNKNTRIFGTNARKRTGLRVNRFSYNVKNDLQEIGQFDGNMLDGAQWRIKTY
jgi:hypothetical protein